MALIETVSSLVRHSLRSLMTVLPLPLKGGGLEDGNATLTNRVNQKWISKNLKNCVEFQLNFHFGRYICYQTICILMSTEYALLLAGLFCLLIWVCIYDNLRDKIKTSCEVFLILLSDTLTMSYIQN